MTPQITCITPIDSTKARIRSAAYVRVSTNKDDQQNSFAAQYLHYQKALENNPTEDFVDIYADEHDSFYIEDNHEAIVTKDTFEMAKQLREGRVPVCLSQDRRTSFLSGRIHCSDCGAVNRIVNVKGIRYWGCRTHLEDASKCPAKKVPESEIQRAFTEMYNKLKYNQKVIIQPMLQQLLALKNSITSQIITLNSLRNRILRHQSDQSNDARSLTGSAGRFACSRRPSVSSNRRRSHR